MRNHVDRQTARQDQHQHHNRVKPLKLGTHEVIQTPEATQTGDDNLKLDTNAAMLKVMHCVDSDENDATDARTKHKKAIKQANKQGLMCGAVS